MKNKRILKSAALALGTVASVAAPIAAVVSCGGTSVGRYETADDGKVRIMTSFSANGAQYAALQDMVDGWNKLNPTKKIELADVEGGYKAIPPALAKSFMAHDTDKVPNLIIDYPDTLGTLTKYHMLLSLEDDRKTGAISKKFSPTFLAPNDQIGGTKSGKLYAMPLAKSIEMAGWNTPVFKVIWDAAAAAGLVEGDSLPDDMKAHADGDKGGVGKVWKIKTGTDLPKFTTTPKYTFADIRDNALDMLDFAAKARTLFVANNSDHTIDNYVLGIDSSANFMYQTAFQLGGANFAKFIFDKGADGYIEYKYDDPSVKANFEKIYNALKKAIDNDAVYINKGGAYASGLEVKHQIAVAYGSTAGYSYDFKKGTSQPVVGGKAVLEYTDAFEGQTKDTNDIIGKFSTYHTQIALSSATSDKLTAAKFSSHDVKLPDADTDAKVQALIKKAGELSPSAPVFVSSSAEITKAPEDKGHFEKVQIKGGEHPKFIFFTDKTIGADSSLQEDEFKVTATPTKATKDDAKRATLIQGPSLIGIHNNAKEDAIVKEFVKWVVAPKTSAAGALSPADVFAAAAGYTIPTVATLSQPKPGDSMNQAQKLTFNTLKDINSKEDYIAFDNPVDDSTAETRQLVEATINEQFNKHKTGSPTMSFETMYRELKDN